MSELSTLIKEAREDPTLFSTIDVDTLLDKIDENHFLENKTVSDLSKDILEALQTISCPNIEKVCLRLSGYQPIDRLCDLRLGRLIRWIKRSGGSLTNGGLLMDVKIENKGVKLLCKNNMNRLFNLSLEENVIFQKLTPQEEVILSAINYISK